MRLRILLPLSAAFALAAPAAASAAFAHTVAAGESLSSVAAADGITVDQLAAANGVSVDSQITAGSTLMIPPQTSSGTSSAGVATSSSAVAATGDGDGDSDDPGPTGAVSSGATSSASASSGSAGGYVVQPGDTLSAIAARAGVSVAGLASANGLDPNAILPSGTSLTLSGGSSSGTAAPVSTSSSAGSSSSGSYVVQAGDTLSAIAARAGVSVAALAVANGLDPNGILPAGTALTLSGGSSSGTAVPVSTSTASASGQPVGPSAQGTASAPPYPTPETVTASQVGQIASANGVSPSLAAAIGYQESGFNNDLVSSADARGVMQILPGTWDWINRTLTSGTPLAPASAAENVRGGVLLLHSLLNSTGGDPALAAAGYYQGLSSVRANGMFNDTQNYVNNIMALRQRFGGG
jgi:LysM repeat protein